MIIKISRLLYATSLIIFTSASLSAQEGLTILYEVSNTEFDLKNFNNSDNLPLTYAQLEKINYQKRSEKTIYSLSIKNYQSLFHFEKSLIPWLENASDETLRSFYKNENQKKRQPQYFKDLSKQELYVTGGSLPEDYMVEDDLRTLNKWKLMDGDSVISGFQCKAAKYISKESTIAWYTMDIPIPDGPKHYSGLPGLIVAVKQDNGYVISISRIEKMNIDHSIALSPELKPIKVTYTDWREQFPEMPSMR